MLQDVVSHSVVPSGKDDALRPPPPPPAALVPVKTFVWVNVPYTHSQPSSSKKKPHHLRASTAREVTQYTPTMPPRHRESIQHRSPDPTTAAAPIPHSPAEEKEEGSTTISPSSPPPARTCPSAPSSGHHGQEQPALQAPLAQGLPRQPTDMPSPVQAATATAATATAHKRANTHLTPEPTAFIIHAGQRQHQANAPTSPAPPAQVKVAAVFSSRSRRRTSRHAPPHNS
jgi:hypothetical protein